MLPIENIPQYRKHSKTILIHRKKKIDPLILAKYRPIALENTIYKLYTNMLTTFLTSYGKEYKILHF
jgi:hypothetical protein